MKKIWVVAFAMAGLWLAPAAQAQDFKTDTTSGVKYQILKPGKGERIKKGDFVSFHMQVTTLKDSVLHSTYAGVPMELQVQPSHSPGDFMAALQLLHSGDSAVLLYRTSELFNPIPYGMKPEDPLKMTVSIQKVETQTAFEARMKAEKEAQLRREIAQIEDYLSTNKLTARKTASGLYYVVENPGTGTKAEAGKMVSVHYTGKLLDGKKFDSSHDRGTPFSFVLGKGQVIQGWDEGIALFSQGGKGKLIIPSSLGYGARDIPGIPANSILVFDIELLGVN